MDRVLPTVSPPTTVTDGFGQRITGVDSETGDQVELLEFAPQIVEDTGFVTALAERVARFASVRHASYVHLRRLDRPAADRLQLVSDLTPGWRLSELLDESAAANIRVDISVAIALLRQLLPAAALFGRHNRENAIGALSPHRLIVTPQARLVIAEHAFGPAIDKLNLGRDRLWRDFRVSMPPSAGLPRANARADANGIGVVALSLLLGRSLELDEYPNQLEALVDGAQEYRNGQGTPLSPPFKNWLKRALQFDVSSAFQSPSESQLAFESVLASDRSYVTSSPALARWVKEVGGTIDIKRTPPPSPEPVVARETVPAQQAEAPLEAPLVITSSSGAAMTPAADAAEVQEIEIPLDEPEVKPELHARAVTQPEPASQLEAEAERATEPEPEPVEPARPTFTRQQLEEDPIARELLNYKPKYESTALPLLPTPSPGERESEPVRESARKPQRDRLEALYARLDPPAEERVPDPEPEPEVEPVKAVAPVEEPVPVDRSEPVDVPEAVEELEAVAEPEPVEQLEPVEEPAPVEELEAVEEAEPVEDSPLAAEQPEAAEDQPEPAEDQPEAAREVQAFPDTAPTPRLYEPSQPPPDEDAQPLAAMYEDPSMEAVAEDTVVEETDHEPVAPVLLMPPSTAAPRMDVPGSETEDKKSPFSNPVVLALVGAVVVLLAVTGWLLTRSAGGGGMRAGEGELVVQSRPEGALVKIDGEVKGNTPLTVRMDAGAHVLEVQIGKSEPRVIPLMIAAGMQTSQYVELQGVAKTGSLEIRSEPAGARITVDGRPRGTTPTTLSDLTPGDHTVVLEAGGRKVSQTVRIQAGSTAQLVVPMRR